MKIKPKEKLSNRESFYKLLDSLKEKDFHAVLKFAEFVQTRNGKKTLQEILDTAEYDEDELSEETMKDINKSRNEYRKGKTYSLEQVKKELGL